MAGATPADSNTISFVRFPIVTKNKVYFFNVYDGICMSTINNDGTINPPIKVNETFSANKVFINEHHYIIGNKLYLEFLMPDQNTSTLLRYYFATLDVDSDTGVIDFNTADIKQATPFDQQNFRKNALIFLNTHKYFIYSIDAYSTNYEIGYLKKLSPNDFFAQYRNTDNPNLFTQLTKKITTDNLDLPGFYKVLTFVNNNEIYIYNEKSIYRLRIQDNDILTQGILQFNFINLLTTLSYNNTAVLSSENYNVSSIKTITTHDKLYIVSIILRDLNTNDNLHLPYVLTFDINTNNDLINPVVVTNLEYDVIYNHTPAFGINVLGSSTTLPIYTYNPAPNSPSQVYYNLNDPLVFVTKNHINILQPNIYKNNIHNPYGLLSIPCNFGKNDYINEYTNIEYVDINNFNHGKPWQWQNGFNSNILADNFYTQLTLESSFNITDPIIATVVTKNKVFVFCEKNTANQPKITYLKKLELDNNSNIVNYDNITVSMLSDIKVEDALFYMNKIYVIGKLSHSYYYSNGHYSDSIILTFDIDYDGNLINPLLLDSNLANNFNNILNQSYTYIDLAGKICGLTDLYVKSNPISDCVVGLDINESELETVYNYVNDNIVNNNFDIAQFKYIKTNYGMLMYVTYKSIDTSFRNYTEVIKVTVSKITNAINYELLGICSSSIINNDVKNFIVINNFAYFIAKDYNPIYVVKEYIPTLIYNEYDPMLVVTKYKGILAIFDNDPSIGLNYKVYKIDLTNPTIFTFLGFIPDNKVTNNYLPIVVKDKVYFISSLDAYSISFNGGSNNYMIAANENYIYSQTYFKLPLVEPPQDFSNLKAYIKA